jgi:hypothetical protein
MIEAKENAGSIHHLNAPYAVVYAFTERDTLEGGINCGERLGALEIKDQLTGDRWDGFVDLESGAIHLLEEGKHYCLDANRRVIVDTSKNKEVKMNRN